MPTAAFVKCAQDLQRLPDDFLTLDVEQQNRLLLTLRAIDRAALQTCEARRLLLEQRVRTDNGTS